MAALAIVKESQFPTLNSILFGEGVVNDAAAILIYQAVVEMIQSNQGGASSSKQDLPISAKLIGLTVWNFLYISFLSILLGVAFGLISAAVSKFFTSFKESPAKEVSLILLFSYLAYIISEV